MWLATNVLCSLPHVLSNRRAHAATTHTRLRLAVCVALLAAPAPHSRQLLRAPVQYSACRGCCGVCGAKRGVLVEGGASPRQQGARGNGGGVVGTREQGRGRGISKGGAAALAREGLRHELDCLTGLCHSGKWKDAALLVQSWMYYNATATGGARPRANLEGLPPSLVKGAGCLSRLPPRRPCLERVMPRHGPFALAYDMAYSPCTDGAPGRFLDVSWRVTRGAWAPEPTIAVAEREETS